MCVVRDQKKVCKIIYKRFVSFNKVSKAASPAQLGRSSTLGNREPVTDLKEGPAGRDHSHSESKRNLKIDDFSTPAEPLGFDGKRLSVPAPLHRVDGTTFPQTTRHSVGSSGVSSVKLGPLNRHHIANFDPDHLVS